mmetsp:Transcript_13919/g.35819  ORF Transcript_13919/g.35819 Transcript_13919/m.35819 type:complete len:161 (+) Transcript_13919:357-839(+)
MGCLTSKHGDTRRSNSKRRQSEESYSKMAMHGQSAIPAGFAVRYTNSLKTGYLQFAFPAIRFVDETGGAVHQWELEHLRGFGQVDLLFSFETGRRCPNGVAVHMFEVQSNDDLNVALNSCIRHGVADGTSASEYDHLRDGGSLSKRRPVSTTEYSSLQAR